MLELKFYLLTYSVLMILLSNFDQASDLWQQLELASELKSDLWDNVKWGRNWLVDFSAGKTQLVLFELFINTGAIHVKMVSLFLRKNNLLKYGVDFLF